MRRTRANLQISSVDLALATRLLNCTIDHLIDERWILLGTDGARGNAYMYN